jgi:hypothetical protein
LRQLTFRAAIDGLPHWENLGTISTANPVYASIIDDVLILAEGYDTSVADDRLFNDLTNICLLCRSVFHID